MAKNDLLKEAIADAKAVRETAIANAKLALEEAFTPKLQSMLSNKIQEEEDEDVSLVGDEGDATVADVADDDSGLGQADEDTEVQSADPGNGGEEEGGDETDDSVHENEEEEEVVETYEEDEEPTGASDTEPMEEAEEEDMEEDLELESIIRELEDEEGMEEGEEEEEMAESTDGMEGESKNLPDASKGAAGKNTGKKEMQEGEEEEVEEMDIEEVINALKEDDEEEMEEGEKEDDELNAAYETIKYLKDKINEVNLLNAKLLFSNKLFRANNLNEGQKMKVIETFDRANSVREVKLVYSTLAESLSAYSPKRKRTVAEGFASKSTNSTKPNKSVIVESNQFANRMKKLAGLL